MLEVPFLTIAGPAISIAEISSKMDDLQRNGIEMLPWEAFNYKPEVAFSIAHNGEQIFLKYYVTEKAIKAVYKKINEPVYKDSCVEFFIAFNGDKNYYNFEFNYEGTCRAGYGINRNERMLLPEDVIEKIRFKSFVEPKKTGASTSWELALSIPLEAFHYHQFQSLNGIACRANFYKCGDDLPEPHFLAYKNIETDEPNFHQPQSFGDMRFN